MTGVDVLDNQLRQPVDQFSKVGTDCVAALTLEDLIKMTAKAGAEAVIILEVGDQYTVLLKLAYAALIVLLHSNTAIAIGRSNQVSI
ncbi:hypothetical protein SAMN02745746_01949 [Pseudogulbenkiania subflava DSM 22618]|uniref:Uncharacterized protein n=1 Tax=Pseudogulbenkiania subflava DSM 22618 TaxID=1123014 RepID=A0A1Y6BWP3_9NEIS|nr:hypothetical protein SAMN02745746_01949 [Pseudogulbenkiania subflava DSM 22618]